MQNSVTATVVVATSADNAALSQEHPFCMALELSDTAWLVKQDSALSKPTETGMINS